MSDEKSSVSDKAGEIAKNIWLAGVGAYGKAVEDAQGRLEKAMEPPKLFKDLVKAGAALEEDAREALSSTSSARQSVEERIARVRDNFHLQRPARIEDLIALTKQVEQLSRKVDALAKAVDEQGQKVPKRATAGSSRAKKKPASKKKAAGKSAAKTSTAGSSPAKRRTAAASKRRS
tara:strand:+ start:6518 stop:7045 length:528 start_codon:yes stop_codon:yes gene_type:complete